MYVVNNLDELSSALGADKGLQRSVSKTVMDDVKIQRYINELVDSLNKGFQDYLNSYSPIIYKRRTNGVENAFAHMSNKDIIAVREGGFVYLKFTDSAWVPSNQGHMSFLPALIEGGWKHKGADAQSNRYRYYAGFHFIDAVVQAWNKKCLVAGIPLVATCEKLYESRKGWWY